MGLGPGVERVHLCFGCLLPDSMALVSRQAFDVALEVVELANAIQRLFSDLGLGSSPDVVEVAPEMRPAGGLAELGTAISACFIENLEAGVSIGL